VNGQTLTVAHNDMFSLAHNPEPGFFQRTYGVEVIYAREFGQGQTVTSTLRKAGGNDRSPRLREAREHFDIAS
jgi:hypothetical protein